MTGVREMCDVCDATLFNHHWACARCGFVVCIDCYRSRREGRPKRTWGDANEKDRDPFSWLLCTTRQQHEPERLMLVQIIAGDALEALAGALDRATADEDREGGGKVNGEVNGKVKEEDEEDKKRVNGDGESTETKSVTMSDIIDKAVEDSIDNKKETSEKKVIDVKTELKHFSRKSGETLCWRHSGVLKSSFKHEDTALLHSKISQAWLDGGKVLQLREGLAKGEEAEAALELFREAWLRGRPVLVEGVTRNNEQRLWSPEYFSENFGDINADFVNVVNNSKITNEPLRFFWEGFSDVEKRKAPRRNKQKSEEGKEEGPSLEESSKKNGEEGEAESASISPEEKSSSSSTSVVALKICDWPPTGDEFGEMLPDHARDLLSNLPLSCYTSRRSQLNMAACLPDVFVRSDLGPRPCFVQGLGASAKDRCSVNLHSEVSDSVSVILHCADPSPSMTGEASAELLEELLEPTGAKLDDVTRAKVTLEDKKVGCLWQVFHPVDADKIRDFLNETEASSRELDYDPIHEADRFLDSEAIRRLHEERGVEAFSVVQFVGEAIVLPAGAPRQVHINYCTSPAPIIRTIFSCSRSVTSTAASPCPWTLAPPKASPTATS